MALVVKDRVRETSVTQGTGTFTLDGAVTGYQSFSAIGNGNTTYYTIYLQASNEWEVGIGTYTASGTTLSRDTILASSNGGSVVNFSAGTKDVFVTYPAGRSVYYDTATNVTVNQLSATTVDATNVEVTNIKAKDGTAALSIADSTGAVTVATALTANGGAVFNENGADVDFRVESDTDTHALFVDASANNVGIGTSSPSYKLVSGVARGSVGWALYNTNAASYDGWLASTSDNGLAINARGQTAGNATGNTLYLQTGDTTRATLDSSGNLGLGVTPSTGGYGRAFQINHAGNGGALTAQSINTNDYPVNLTANAVSSGAATWKYVNTDGGSASRYQQVAGIHSWYTAPSGTAGNAITFTQAMTLDASGNLLVGNTDGAYRLTVSSGNAVVVTSGTTGTSGFALFDTATGGNHIGSVTRQGNGIDVASYDQVSFRTGATSGISSGTERARITSIGGFETRPAASGHAVFNEDGVDADFRVESDANTHAFFVDAGAGRIGINKSVLSGGAGVEEIAGILQMRVGGSNTAFLLDTGVDYAGLKVTSGPNNDSGSVNYWDITTRPSYASGVATGGDISAIRIDTPYAGQNTVVINEGSANLDFRVESDNNQYMLWVDASADGVNIGGFDTIQGQLNVIKNTGDLVASTTALYITTGQTYGSAANSKNLDLVFQGYRDGAGTGGGAKARLRALEQTADSRVGSLLIDVLDSAGDLQNVLELTSSNVVVNQGGIDMDFRVESDTNTHALFLDAGQSRVYFGGATAPATGAPVLVTNGYAAVDTTTAGVSPSGTDILSTARASIGGYGGNYLSFGAYNDNVTAWIQSSYYVPNTAVYNMVLQPLGGNVGVGRYSSQAKLHVEAAPTNASLQIWQNSRTRASGNYYGVEFRDNADEANANIVIQQQNSGNNAAQMEFYVNAGTGGNGLRNGVQALTLYPTVAVINEGSADYDFRVESDTDTHCLFVDAGNSRVGVATSSPLATFQVGDPLTATAGIRVSGTNLNVDAGYQSAGVNGTAAAPSLILGGDDNTGIWHPASDTLAISTAGLERARITSGGIFEMGGDNGLTSALKLSVTGATGEGAFLFKNDAGANQWTGWIWNTATSGDNLFVNFLTEGGSGTGRGSITYNRGGGVVAYNTTSDYRAKDLFGPVQNSGQVIDALKVYTGKMKGATIERPMLVAHEAQEHVPYAVTGEKDAVNEDGTPKYQQMDVSSLVPLLLAEIQSLRARVAQLEGK